MKIGILTFCNGYNYGAILQCYALQEFLKSKKIDAEVINFRKERKYSKYGLNILSPAFTLRKLYSFKYKNDIKKKHDKFNSFFKNSISFYPENSISENDISEYAKKYNIIIFGSDQIWNLSDKIYDKSRIFWGDFEFSGKKISYAASFGDSLEIAQENIEYVKYMLQSFTNISIREKSGSKFLEQNGIRNTHVVDPTLLLKKEKWIELCKSSGYKKNPEKYILYYSVNCRKYSWKVAKKLAKITGLKVINLEEHPKIIGANFINDYTEGPSEFLDLINKAEYIVTNSFHGTIFSIIFQKRFIPVFDFSDGKIIKEERKYSVLEMAGLLNLITTSVDKIDISKYDGIDYNLVSKKLSKKINQSYKFLENSLEELND